jgi:8-oxo-dGTP pyrophosphatase MutT (NUDIX family)
MAAYAIRDDAIRDAATVVLIRDASDGDRGTGLEVYLLQRASTMAAFAGLTVFPGGSVDPADVAEVDLPWHGPAPSAWADVLAAGPALARGLVCAAVRETFEESGVLLAGPSGDELVDDTSTPEWEQARCALESRELSLSRLLTDRRLVLRADLLKPWAHWITPTSEPRRFDTRFFMATMPPGQQTRDIAREADHVAWVRPGDALADADRRMVPPTRVTLEELERFADIREATSEPRTIRPILPRLVRKSDGTTEFALSDAAVLES